MCFFKQMTAYELRISDWSSDVCSSDLDHPAINPKQSKHWALDIAVAFPTLHINLSPGGFWSHRFWPISVNRTRWEAEFHVPKPLTGREKLQQELYITRIAEILLEDVTNTERTQRGIEAGAYD